MIHEEFGYEFQLFRKRIKLEHNLLTGFAKIVKASVLFRILRVCFNMSCYYIVSHLQLCWYGCCQKMARNQGSALFISCIPRTFCCPHHPQLIYNWLLLSVWKFLHQGRWYFLLTPPVTQDKMFLCWEPISKARTGSCWSTVIDSSSFYSTLSYLLAYVFWAFHFWIQLYTPHFWQPAEYHCITQENISVSSLLSCIISWVESVI